MRRRLRFVVSALALGGFVGAGHPPYVVVESGTPVAEGMPPGVAARLLGLGCIDTLPAGTTAA